MPSASPAPAPSPIAVMTVNPGFLYPTLGPMFPHAGPIGVIVIAVAYFSLGVAVGGLMKQSPRARRWLPVLVVPGLLAALAFIGWVFRSLQ